MEQHLDGVFFALNGDIFNDLDFTAMLNFHRQRGARATIALTPVEDPTAYGLVETGSESRITRFLEKPDPSQITTNMINAGTYVLEPAVLDIIPPDVPVSIERQTFPRLVGSGEPVYAYPSHGYWMDMGTPDKYLQLHRDLLSGKSSWYTPSSSDEVVIGRDCRIDATAEIDGPVIIGDGCTVGPRARLVGPVVVGAGCAIGNGTVIEDSIIWDTVEIGSGVSLKSSIIANNCIFEDGSGGEGLVISDNVMVAGGALLEPGTCAQPGETVKPG